jgi:hypothetical protein
MKHLPRLEEQEMEPGRLYLACFNADEGSPGYTDEDHFYGPVGGLQLTYCWLRDPADGEHVGRYDPVQEMWTVLVDAEGHEAEYSDVILTWKEEEPDVSPTG